MCSQTLSKSNLQVILHHVIKAVAHFKCLSLEEEETSPKTELDDSANQKDYGHVDDTWREEKYDIYE